MRKKHDNIRLYHVDHLGSTSLVTDIDGEITQHVAYIPYGEVFVEQRNGSWSTPYLFNAKELDEETGLYYYGARYLDPTNAAWLSVDPLFEKYVGMTPYNYCAGNPVKLVDVDGRAGLQSEQVDGSILVESNVVICLKKLHEINVGSKKANKKNERIIAENQKKISEIKNDIYEHYLCHDLKNTEGRTVKFQFYYYEYYTDDPCLLDRKEMYEVSNKYSLFSSQTRIVTKKGTEIKYQARPAIFTQRYIVESRGSGGLTEGSMIISEKRDDAPKGTYSHELLHTFGVPDNDYNQGGLLNNPPASQPTPEEIDSILKHWCYPR